MAGGRSPERSPKAGAVDGCARCTRSCPGCPAASIDFGKANVRVVGGAKEILFDKSQRAGINTLYILGSSEQRGGAAPTPINKFVSKETSGEICSKCNELASICSHSTKTSDLKAA